MAPRDVTARALGPRRRRRGSRRRRGRDHRRGRRPLRRPARGERAHRGRRAAAAGGDPAPRGGGGPPGTGRRRRGGGLLGAARRALGRVGRARRASTPSAGTRPAPGTATRPRGTSWTRCSWTAPRQPGRRIRRGSRAVDLTVAGGRVDGVLTDDGPLPARHVIDAGGRRHWSSRRLAAPVERVSPRLIASWGHLDGGGPRATTRRCCARTLTAGRGRRASGPGATPGSAWT